MIKQSRWDFWKHVDKRSINECWEWKRAVSSTGHPKFGAEGKLWYVHRLVWEQRNGPIPQEPNTVIMHMCNNSRCCNPSHLLLGTKAMNSEHAGFSGRLSRKGETNGRAKISSLEIAVIRTSNNSAKELATQLGISKSQINRIRRREQWAK